MADDKTIQATVHTRRGKLKMLIDDEPCANAPCVSKAAVRKKVAAMVTVSHGTVLLSLCEGDDECLAVWADRRGAQAHRKRVIRRMCRELGVATAHAIDALIGNAEVVK
jgi:hypothetical protein